VIVDVIESHRNVCGVEPICAVVPIVPSTYDEHRARKPEPEKRSARAKRDELLRADIRRVWNENCRVYGADEVWSKLGREGFEVARWTVEPLVREMGLRGVVRGRALKLTTVSSGLNHRPADLVRWRFSATQQNRRWVADLTHVATWDGIVYVAFIIDAFSRPIVAWRVSSPPRSDLAFDALEQALRAKILDGNCVHHSDRRVQYLSYRYNERLAETGVEGSVGRAGEWYDNALAESVNDLFITEVIRQRGPSRNIDTVEYARLDWVDWLDTRRLLEPIGYVPPAEYERTDN
jgi:transposase InsO family protein